MGAESPDISTNVEMQNFTIGIIPSGSDSPFHLELITGANKTAIEYGWNTIIITPDNEENITAQKTAMKALIERNVDIISLNTLDPQALTPEIRAAEKARIPVIMHNTLTPVPSLNITTYIGYNQYTGAAEMGTYAARLLAEKKNEDPKNLQGNVFILRGLPGFHADQRTAGFITGIKTSPGLKIVGEEEAGWRRDTAKQVATQALSERKGIDIFYGNSDEMAIGAALAAQEQGKEINKDIFCLGIDGNAPTLEMIQNGTMTATLGVYPDLIGRTIIIQAQAIQKGEPVSRFTETPIIVVDKENIQAYLNRSTWTNPTESVGELLRK
jgi:ribose transport system substrate-binding protein